MTNYIGHICADAKTRLVEKVGSVVTEFTIAENYTTRKGESKPQYVRIAIWGERAKLGQWAKKGRLVQVDGRVFPGAYLNKETNEIVTYLQMNNPQVKFLDKKPEEEVPAIPEATAEEAEAESDDRPF